MFLQGFIYLITLRSFVESRILLFDNENNAQFALLRVLDRDENLSNFLNYTLRFHQFLWASSVVNLFDGLLCLHVISKATLFSACIIKTCASLITFVIRNNYKNSRNCFSTKNDETKCSQNDFVPCRKHWDFRSHPFVHQSVTKSGPLLVKFFNLRLHVLQSIFHAGNFLIATRKTALHKTWLLGQKCIFVHDDQATCVLSSR